MANIKSQIKRIKTNEQAHLRNAAAKSAVRTVIKKAKKAIEAKDLAAAETLVAEAYKLIDKSVSDKVQHAKTAARQKSEIARLVNGLKK
ncbi:MAG: 30S ribosomal protein S20 [Erysipelotrichaceae bacterium]|nr:30S ribosomal protein S20 [Erysipelotrichaceae bacterium]